MGMKDSNVSRETSTPEEVKLRIKKVAPATNVSQHYGRNALMTGCNQPAKWDVYSGDQRVARLIKSDSEWLAIDPEDSRVIESGWTRKKCIERLETHYHLTKRGETR